MTWGDELVFILLSPQKLRISLKYQNGMNINYGGIISVGMQVGLFRK
jgi:hypothetical protein